MRREGKGRLHSQRSRVPVWSRGGESKNYLRGCSTGVNSAENLLSFVLALLLAVRRATVGIWSSNSMIDSCGFFVVFAFLFSFPEAFFFFLNFHMNSKGWFLVFTIQFSSLLFQNLPCWNFILGFTLGLNLVRCTWFFKERMMDALVAYVLLMLFSVVVAVVVHTFSYNRTCFYQ